MIVNTKLILSGCLITNEKKEILLLFKKNHQHYETPGGKIEPFECRDPQHPTIDELRKTAERETFEELGNSLELTPFTYFGKVNFTIPDGREAIAHKFLTSIVSGNARVAEPEVFSKLEWLPLGTLDSYPVSPDLKLLAETLKELANGTSED